MTTDVQIPYVDLLGDGSITRFEFTFSIVETLDLYVFVDNVLQVEYSAYTVDNLDDYGGDVVFTEAPGSGARVLIFRKTTISQNVDYETYPSFPSDTHEWNLDKITFILQELIQGLIDGVDSDGNPYTLTFDLSVTPNETTVTINNSGGTDAVIPMWTNAEYAGVYAGKVDLEANLPADESPTTEPDGYVWLGY